MEVPEWPGYSDLHNIVTKNTKRYFNLFDSYIPIFKFEKLFTTQNLNLSNILRRSNHLSLHRNRNAKKKFYFLLFFFFFLQPINSAVQNE